jgi:protein-L-isoaspartate O-methyltransferase
MMTTTEPSDLAAAAALRRACADAIEAKGGFGTGQHAQWLRELFLAVPREDFVPSRVWWPQPDGQGRYPLLDRDRDPRRWMEAVYDPHTAVITQVDDGRVRPEDGATTSSAWSSSASAPSVVVQMLRHASPAPGDRVLEVGTGTGYNTRLLSLRVTGEHHGGAGGVTSVEVDERLAAAAREQLAAAGDTAKVITGDGAAGHLEGAPYDLLISTVCVQQIPPAWAAQVRAGGRILTPVATPMGTDALALLVPDGRGEARGPLVAAVDFMMVREQRRLQPWSTAGWPRLLDFTINVGPGGQHVQVSPTGR